MSLIAPRASFVTTLFNHGAAPYRFFEIFLSAQQRARRASVMGETNLRLNDALRTSTDAGTVRCLAGA